MKALVAENRLLKAAEKMKVKNEKKKIELERKEAMKGKKPVKKTMRKNGGKIGLVLRVMKRKVTKIWQIC